MEPWTGEPGGPANQDPALGRKTIDFEKARPYCIAPPINQVTPTPTSDKVSYMNDRY